MAFSVTRIAAGLLLGLPLAWGFQQQFQSCRLFRNLCQDRTFRARQLQVFPVDPNMAVDVGIAVASAAAGAASQFPRIQQLERELNVAKTALTESEQEMVTKITELEERLFQMDKEFEEQTDRFKKKYDTRMRGELEKIKEKIVTDYKYKLEIKLEEQKSKLLEERLDFVNTLSSGKAEQLVNLRMEKESMNRANEELEKALAMSQAELDRMRQEASKKKGWWPFS